MSWSLLSSIFSSTPTRSRTSAADFWKAYAEGRLTELRRLPDRSIEGSIIVQQHGGTDGRIEHFIISADDLAAYDYDANPRFRVGVYASGSASLCAIVEARLMDRETLPNRQQLDLVSRMVGLECGDDVPYARYRADLLEVLRNVDLSAGRLEQRLDELAPGRKDYLRFRGDGDLDHLRAAREILIKGLALLTSAESTADALLRVVQNRANDDTGIVSLALWALGRHNWMPAAHALADLFRKPDMGHYRMVVERALQFLCSGDELVPLSAPDEDPVPHWSRCLGSLPVGSARLRHRDCVSVFWEKRLRAAVESHAVWLEPADLLALQSDEVPVVRAGVVMQPVSADLETRDATEELYVLYRSDLLAIARVLVGSVDDAEDCVQEVFATFRWLGSASDPDARVALERHLRDLARQTRAERDHEVLIPHAGRDVLEDDATRFLRWMIGNLVLERDEIRIEKRVGERGVEFSLYVTEADRGRVIGRSGRTIRALEIVLGGSLATERVRLDIVSEPFEERASGGALQPDAEEAGGTVLYAGATSADEPSADEPAGSGSADGEFDDAIGYPLDDTD